MGSIEQGEKPASEQLILVTGASSFIGAHVLTRLLDSGYKVRGAVRNSKSAESVRRSHGKYGDQLTFVIVPDITVPHAFDDAVNGVDGVFHLASPFTFNVTDNESELLVPAIKGTTGILESVHEHAPQVKRVVVTSSFAAMIDVTKGLWPEHAYTEADWCPFTYEDGKNGPSMVAYIASKKLAEEAAFQYVDEHKPSFTLTTICPPLVYGPNAHTVESKAKLNTSSADIYRLIAGGEQTVPETSIWSFVDVRDVADAHIRAYETPKAAGQRYSVAAGNFSHQQACDIIRKHFPELKDRTPEGNPGQPLPPVYKMDSSKTENELGITFRGLEETIIESVKSLLSLEQGFANE